MRVRPLLLMLLLFSPALFAGEAAAPSLALLEYLGEWQDEDGNEIDPQALALLELEAATAGGSEDDQE